MSALVALAGWPDARPSPEAWTRVGPHGAPIVLDAVSGPGPDVGRAVSADGRVMVFVAGTIANRREIEDGLGLSAMGGIARGDAAVLLRLYEGRGENALTALRGGFACAIWDGRRQRLVLARDQLGLASLFFVAERSRCAAASALGPLLALPHVAASPDLATVDVLMAFGTVPAPATMYAGIRQLAPGELLVWEGGRHRVQRYWQLRFPEGRESRHVRSREAARRAREQLDDVIRQRTAGVVSGLCLSGGLGATTLLALATAQGRAPARLVSVVLTENDDTRRAREVGRRARVPHDVLHGNVDWAAAVDRMLEASGAPIGDACGVVLAPALAALSGRGFTVFAGTGLEEVVGGGPAERAWRRCDRYRALPGLVREAVDIVSASGYPRGLVWTARAARSAPVDVFADMGESLPPTVRMALYGAELRGIATRAPARRALVPLVGEAALAGASEAGDTLYYVSLALGVARAGAMAAASAPPGVDVRLPAIDPRLAQMAAAVPARARAGARERARLVLGALGDALPREVRRAPHATLAPAAPAWRTGSLAAFAEEAFAEERLARIGVFDPAAVRTLWTTPPAGPDVGEVLWRIASVLRWLERPALAVGYVSTTGLADAVVVSP